MRLAGRQRGFTLIEILVAITIVAIVLSSLFEGLRWHPATFVGVALSVAGTVLVLRCKAAAPARVSSR